MRKEAYINVVEQQIISNAIIQVKESVLKRCEELKCDNGEISSALYSVQDYIDEQNNFPEGYRIERRDKRIFKNL